MTLNKTDLTDIELEVLKEAIFRRYGYDFRHYAKASFRRRSEYFLDKTDFTTISELVPRIIHDKSFFESFFYNLCITVSEMFRDPSVFKVIRNKVVPMLRTFPFVKVWVAGCATGEEAYTMAILLQEEGLYHRAQIYATDFNEEALARAKKGIFSIERIKEFTRNYLRAGGRKSFSDYCLARYDSAIMNKELKENIVFANHNLASDSVFGEMHLILCRNVLIYFDKTLQNRVLALLNDSLVHNGFLCLGSKESLYFSEVAASFNAISEGKKIFQKKNSQGVTAPGENKDRAAVNMEGKDEDRQS